LEWKNKSGHKKIIIINQKVVRSNNPNPYVECGLCVRDLWKDLLWFDEEKNDGNISVCHEIPDKVVITGD
jgi:hypothetical protein